MKEINLLKRKNRDLKTTIKELYDFFIDENYDLYEEFTITPQIIN